MEEEQLSGSPKLSASELAPFRSRRSMHTHTKEDEKDYKLKIAQTEIEELKQSLRYVEIQFAKAKEVNAAVTQKLHESQEQIVKLKEELREQMHLNHNQGQQIKELHLKLEDALSVHHDLTEKSHMKLEQAKQETQKREEDVAKLRATLKTKSDELAVVTVEKEVLIKKMKDVEEELEFKSRDFVNLQARLLDKEKELDAITLNRQVDDKHLLEFQQLKTDNQRLLRLLKSTNEFKDFSVSEPEGESLRFIPLPQTTEAKLNRGKSLSSSQKLASTRSTAGPDDHWIPTEAYKVAEAFKAENNLDISSTLINKLLAELNRIWKEREWRQINKIKKEASLEIMSLRRQLALQLPFDALKEEEQLRKLKAELKKTQTCQVRMETSEAYIRPVELLEYEPPKEEHNEDKERADALAATLSNLVSSVDSEAFELKKTLNKAIAEFCDNKERDIPALKRRTKDALLVRLTQKKIVTIVDGFKGQVVQGVSLPPS